VVRLAKDPFRIREAMGDITDQEGKGIKTQQERAEVFIKHNLVSHGAAQPDTPLIAHSPVPFREADEMLVRQVKEMLSKTRNNSSPGPDRLTYRLIKLIKDTDLGRALMHDIARGIAGQARVPQEHRDMLMV